MDLSLFKIALPPLLAAVAALLPLPGRAQPLIETTRDLSSIRSAGMGDATRGFASSDEAIWVNPAGISGTTRFNLNLSAAFDPVHKHRLFSVGAIDSRLNADTTFPLAGGLAYAYYQSGKGEERRSGSLVGVSLALPLWNEHFTLGVTGKYLKLDGAVESNAMTLDAGVILQPIQMLSLGVVGYNLIDISSPEAERAWGLGLALGAERGFRLAFDVRFDPDPAQDRAMKPSYYAGAEYLIANIAQPRIGYTYDEIRDVHKITGGLSVYLGMLAIEGAYQYAFGGNGHFFGFTLRLIDP